MARRQFTVQGQIVKGDSQFLRRMGRYRNNSEEIRQIFRRFFMSSSLLEYPVVVRFERAQLRVVRVSLRTGRTWR